MQNRLPKFRQSSKISEKPGYMSEKFKTLASSNCDRDEYFQLNNVNKRVLGIFFHFV